MIIDNIKLKEVAESIRVHNRIHSKEPGAVIITECLDFAAEIIDKLDRGEIEPVNYGKWNYYKNNGIVDIYKCSVCEMQFQMAMEVIPSSVFCYCPHCGSKMDKE